MFSATSIVLLATLLLAPITVATDDWNCSDGHVHFVKWDSKLLFRPGSPIDLRAAATSEGQDIFGLNGERVGGFHLSEYGQTYIRYKNQDNPRKNLRITARKGGVFSYVDVVPTRDRQFTHVCLQLADIEGEVHYGIIH